MSSYKNAPRLSRKSYGKRIKSYDQAKKVIKEVGNLGKASLILPSLKQINTVDAIEKGDAVRFEEVDEQGNIVQKQGLAHLYEYYSDSLGSCYIFDNHNHALYWWAMLNAFKNHIGESPLPVIHIDQHSDLKNPLNEIDEEKIDNPEYMYHYTNNDCTVGSFIKPALDAGIITECKQVRSEFSLLELGKESENSEFILDIDLDFWDPAMGIQALKETILITKKLVQQATMVTIATSPYFLDQDYAIKILKKLFD